MGQRFIDVVEIDIFVAVVAEYSLQTGDVLDKRRSRETAKCNDRVLAPGI